MPRRKTIYLNFPINLSLSYIASVFPDFKLTKAWSTYFEEYKECLVDTHSPYPHVLLMFEQRIKAGFNILSSDYSALELALLFAKLRPLLAKTFQLAFLHTALHISDDMISPQAYLAYQNYLQFIKAVTENNLASVLRYLALNTNQPKQINRCQENTGETALMIAAQKGHDAIIDTLLNTRGILINTQDPSGRTALVLAARTGHEKIIKMLLLNGPQYVTRAIDEARLFGHSNIVKTLMTYELQSLTFYYKKTYQSDPHTLRRAIPPHDIWRLFIDGYRQRNNGWRTFEKTEPGYLYAMVDAFQLLFEPNPLFRLSTTYIETLHAKATNNVKGLNYEDKENHDIPTGTLINSTHVLVGYSLSTKNSTQQGLKELYRRKHSGNENDAVQYFLSIKVIEPPNIEHIYLIDEICSTLDSFIETMSQSFQKNGKFTIRHNSVLMEENGYYHQLMLAKLDYQINIKTCKTDLEKLTVIVTLIREFEQTHPFLDANTRVFSMLFLNDLLITNGFPMTMLENPNRFGGYALDELVQEVMNGMASLFNAIQNTAKQSTSIENVTKHLSDSDKRYFLKVIAHEQQHRQSHSVRFFSKKPIVKDAAILEAPDASQTLLNR